MLCGHNHANFEIGGGIRLVPVVVQLKAIRQAVAIRVGIRGVRARGGLRRVRNSVLIRVREGPGDGGVERAESVPDLGVVPDAVEVRVRPEGVR